MTNTVLTDNECAEIAVQDAIGQHWQEVAEEEAAAMSGTLSTDEQLAVLNSVPKYCKGKVRKAVERGMATAEYAVGILAACAFALVLLKIITGRDFFGAMLKFVISLITKVGSNLP